MFQHPYLSAQIAEARRNDLLAAAQRHGLSCQARAYSRGGRIPGVAHRTGRRAITLVVSAAAVLGVVLAVATSADAATSARPTADLVFARNTISQATQPQLVYVAGDLPQGSAIYLQNESAANRTWVTVEQLRSRAGTIRVPRVPAGIYQYRLRVTHGQRVILVSAPAGLAVTSSSGGSGNKGGSTTAWIGPVLSWLLWVVFGS